MEPKIVILVGSRDAGKSTTLRSFSDGKRFYTLGEKRICIFRWSPQERKEFCHVDDSRNFI